ncbi:MAG TPA: hypothetical protein PLX89_25030 [Verrucomicrobiota bacterium]|nr:hypothetical protein [Verrucomicrobiales bacterium]HRI16271.1 hypothetical protein [Verrucomicrobiota bacterium]
MKRSFLIAIYSLGLLFLAVGAEDKQDWSKLESELRGLQSALSEPEILLINPILQQIITHKNTNLLVELAIQDRYSLVAVAGITGLARLDPNLAYQVALGRVWLSTNVSSAHILPFAAQLSQDLPVDRFVAVFSPLALLSPGDWGSAALAVQQVPRKLLIGWLRTGAGRSSLTTVSLVIDNLMPKLSSFEPADQQLVLDNLAALRSAPGYPSAIWLLYGKTSLDELIDGLRTVLGDNSIGISVKTLLLRKHYKQLAKVDNLPFSDRDKRYITELARKYGE